MNMEMMGLEFDMDGSEAGVSIDARVIFDR